MQAHGDSLIGFMDALQLPSAIIIGHSMGGIIAGYAALAAPSKLDKLVLIEPGFYTNKIPAFLQYMFFPLNRIMARQFCSRSMQERFLLVSFYDKSLITEEVVDAYMIPARTPDILDSMAHMMVTAASQKFDGITVQITQPTLLVYGEREKGILPEGANRINGEIKGSVLASVEESGHYLQEEQPEALARIIRDFLG
jgi:pimeloyl-ACP methyl ester carboxylesterase